MAKKTSFIARHCRERLLSLHRKGGAVVRSSLFFLKSWTNYTLPKKILIYWGILEKPFGLYMWAQSKRLPKSDSEIFLWTYQRFILLISLSKKKSLTRPSKNFRITFREPDFSKFSKTNIKTEFIRQSFVIPFLRNCVQLRLNKTKTIEVLLFERFKLKSRKVK